MVDAKGSGFILDGGRMNHFPIIRRVLDRIFVEMLYKYGYSFDQVSQKMRAYLQHMADFYHGRSGPIDFAHPFYRFAYVLIYLPGRVVLLKQIFRQCSGLTKLLSEKILAGQQITGASLGGGPGTELLALKSYAYESMYKDGVDLQFHFTACDFVKAWEDVWWAIDTETNMFLVQQEVPKALVVSDILCGDLAGPAQGTNKLHGKDFYIMSYVISEVSNVPTFKQFLDVLVQSAPRGAVFLAVDISPVSVVNKAIEVFRSTGLNVFALSYIDDRVINPAEILHFAFYTRKLNWNIQENFKAFWLYGVKP
jgi:hypothetical protein